MFGKKNKPFFIAEISSNHNGKIQNALQLIHEAKLYGANAVKLQTYKPSTMTIKSNKKFFLELLKVTQITKSLQLRIM